MTAYDLLEPGDGDLMESIVGIQEADGGVCPAEAIGARRL
jgi:hypothetical protein